MMLKAMKDVAASGQEYQEAIQANIEVHSRLASEYNASEPHYRPESIARVRGIVEGLAETLRPRRALDLGCGTGFMIDILKHFVPRVTGVDVTQPMLDRVDRSGPAEIELINSDTGEVQLDPGSYDLATAYTFLDHLRDFMPTFTTTYRALREGGCFYADLSPNFHFWNAFKQLDTAAAYGPEIARELAAVLSKDAEIEATFGIDRESFRKAEYQKHVAGGLEEDSVRDQLLRAGFGTVQFIYHWYVGQAHLVNAPGSPREENVRKALFVHDALTKMLPLSRHLFKYVGFIATK